MGEGMEGVGQGPWGKQGSDTIDTDLHAEGGGCLVTGGDYEALRWRNRSRGNKESSSVR